MEEVKKIRTHCRYCHGACGVFAHVKDGKVIKVENVVSGDIIDLSDYEDW